MPSIIQNIARSRDLEQTQNTDSLIPNPSGDTPKRIVAKPAYPHRDSNPESSV